MGAAALVSVDGCASGNGGIVFTVVSLSWGVPISCASTIFGDNKEVDAKIAASFTINAPFGRRFILVGSILATTVALRGLVTPG